MQDYFACVLFLIAGAMAILACYFLSGWNRERAEKNDEKAEYDAAILRLARIVGLPGTSLSQHVHGGVVNHPTVLASRIEAEIVGLKADALSGRFTAERSDELKRWKDAVQDELIVCHIYGPKNHEDPKQAINDLMAWSADVALDPLVSQDARDLIEPHADKVRMLQRTLRRLAEQALESLDPCPACAGAKKVTVAGKEIECIACAGTGREGSEAMPLAMDLSEDDFNEGDVDTAIIVQEALQVTSADLAEIRLAIESGLIPGADHREPETFTGYPPDCVPQVVTVREDCTLHGLEWLPDSTRLYVDSETTLGEMRAKLAPPILIPGDIVRYVRRPGMRPRYSPAFEPETGELFRVLEPSQDDMPPGAIHCQEMNAICRGEGALDECFLEKVS